MMRSLLTPGILLLAISFAAAQTADASQSSAIALALASYTSSLLSGPIATSLALEVLLSGDIPSSELASIEAGLPTLLPSFTSNEDLYSFATNPPTTFATPAWVTALPSDVQSDLEELRSSIVEAEASLVASVLGISVEAADVTTSVTSGGTATATATGGASGARATGKGGFVAHAGIVGAVVAAVALL